MLYRAGKSGIQKFAEDEVYHLGQYGDTNKAEGERRDGVLVRPRHRTTSVAVCASITRSTVRRTSAKALRAFPPVSYERAKTVVGRERKKGTRKRYEYFRRSPKKAKTVEK